MYVADFCSYQPLLIVELDGEIHRQQTRQDRGRQETLEEIGFRVLRFPNERVLNHLDSVIAEILLVARDSS